MASWLIGLAPKLVVYLSGEEQGAGVFVVELPQDGRAHVHGQGGHLVKVLHPEEADLTLRLPKIKRNK